MGWSSGSELMDDIILKINKVKPKFTQEQKIAIYKCMIMPFEDCDCDTLYECTNDPAFEAAFHEVHPDYENY